MIRDRNSTADAKISAENLFELGLTGAVIRPTEARRALVGSASFLSDSATLADADNDAVIQPTPIPEAGSHVRFHALQSWEGVVQSAIDGGFTASLHDLTDGATMEDAEFELGDVSDDDRSLVVPGAVFYWTIGYRVERSSQRVRASLVRFRRLPLWDESDLRILGDQMDALRLWLNGEQV